MTSLPVTLQTVVLLVASNVFMTFAMVSMNQPFKADFLWAALCLVAPCTSFSEAEDHSRTPALTFGWIGPRYTARFSKSRHSRRDSDVFWQASAA